MSRQAHQDGTHRKSNESAAESEQSAIEIFTRYIDALDRQPRRAESLRGMLERRGLNVRAAGPIKRDQVGNVIEAFRRFVRATQGDRWEARVRPTQDLRHLGVAVEPRRSKILEAGPDATTLSN